MTAISPSVKKLFSVAIENVVTENSLGNVLDSAFGTAGIFYWCEDINVANSNGGEYLCEIVVNGGSLLISHDSGKTATLDLKAVERGIPLLCKHTGKTWDGFCKDCDGPAADMFVQLCLFGEILYC